MFHLVSNFIGMYLVYWQAFKQCNRTHMSHMHVYLKSASYSVMLFCELEIADK